MRTHTLAVAVLALQASLCFSPAIGAGIDRSGFDPSVRPQDNLFQSANGTWLKDTPIPADKSGYGVITQLRDRADERVRKIVETLALSKAAAGSNEAKIGAYYRSYLDERAIDNAGMDAIAPWLKQIDALKTQGDLSALMGRWQGLVDLPFGAHVYPDRKEPGVYRGLLWQDGLGLPDRDYYIEDNERSTKARAAYLDYVLTLLRLTGDAQAQDHAQAVFALEKRLALAQWSRVDNRDAVKTYNPTLPQGLRESAPGFDWPRFFEAAALPPGDRLSVAQPSYLAAFASMVRDVPLAEWQLYLRVRLLDGSAKVLPKAFRDAEFAFKGRALQGSEQPLPRWQQATAALNAALGEAVGQVYVAQYFPPAYKARMRELVGKLLLAYRQSIDGLSWMGPQTRERAKEKLAKYGVKIGYPDTWRDYTALVVREGEALGNGMRAGRFEYERRARRAGQPVDRGEWGMTPQTVNAYYSPLANEIVFPAAILDVPIFDMAADDAINYGAIGAIIGHEISHGFDDQGSQYDGSGKLDNWWTDADRKAFEKLGDGLVAQFNAYEPVPGHQVNGRLTLGENIADLSGLQIAYKAYQLSLEGKPAPVIDGQTGDQRFFLSWAQAWRSKSREARALQLLTVDTHSPPEFRANGAAVNHDAYHHAFGTKEGDAMYKPADQRIRIW